MRILQETLYAVRGELLSLKAGVGQRIIKGWGEVHASEQATGYFGLRHCHLEGEGDAIHLSSRLLVPEPIDAVPFLEVRPKCSVPIRPRTVGFGGCASVCMKDNSSPTNSSCSSKPERRLMAGSLSQTPLAL